MRWFHEKDGGLMNVWRKARPSNVLYQCAICGQQAYFRSGFLIWPLGKKVVHFSDLPEDLQAIALEEML